MWKKLLKKNVLNQKTYTVNKKRLGEKPNLLYFIYF